MLKKLSLAALVAMGSMSFAGATDLSSAIQGVQLNGYLRVRAYVHQDKKTTGKTDYNRWRTNAKLVFGVPVAESTKIVWRVNAQQNFNTKATENNKTFAGDNTGYNKKSNRNLTNSLFFVNYAKGAVTANVGIIPLGFLPFASSDSFTTGHGAGADATYKISNVTLAAGYVDQMWNSVSGAKDVYTLGAIYKNEDVGNAQLWYARVTNLLKYDVMLMTNLNVLKDYGIGVNFDVAQSKLTTTGADNHKFVNLALTSNVAGLDAKIGYAATNNVKGAINTSDDSVIGAVPCELRDNVANMTDAKSLYAKVGYNIDEATNVFVAYNHIKNTFKKGEDKSKGNSNE